MYHTKMKKDRDDHYTKKAETRLCRVPDAHPPSAMPPTATPISPSINIIYHHQPASPIGSHPHVDSPRLLPYQPLLNSITHHPPTWITTPGHTFSTFPPI